MWRLKLFFLFYIIVINFQHDLALIANFFIVGFITVNIFEHLVNFSNWIFTLTIIIRVTGIIINYDYLLVAIIAKWSPRLTSFQIWQLNNLFFILIWFIVSVHLFLNIFEFRCIFFAFIELKRSWAQLLFNELAVIALRWKLFIMQQLWLFWIWYLSTFKLT